MILQLLALHSERACDARYSCDVDTNSRAENERVEAHSPKQSTAILDLWSSTQFRRRINPDVRGDAEARIKATPPLPPHTPLTRRIPRRSPSLLLDNEVLIPYHLPNRTTDLSRTLHSDTILPRLVQQARTGLSKLPSCGWTSPNLHQLLHWR